jgi:hypothetical protein
MVHYYCLTSVYSCYFMDIRHRQSTSICILLLISLIFGFCLWQTIVENFYNFSIIQIYFCSITLRNRLSQIHDGHLPLYSQKDLPAKAYHACQQKKRQRIAALCLFPVQTAVPRDSLPLYEGSDTYFCRTLIPQTSKWLPASRYGWVWPWAGLSRWAKSKATAKPMDQAGRDRWG